jgi:hypothetical protein
MNIAPPQGPTIPSSTNYLSNFTRILKVTESIEGNYFSSPNPATPGTLTTLSLGTLSNINNPVLDSQGATYAYALAHGGTGNPGEPIKSVQYNNAGAFEGSSSLLFDNITNTLSANKISNGTVTIGLGTISGLTDPISGQQAATKNYVDNYTAINITSINTVGSTTYPASAINGIIYRDTQTSGTTIDILPTAAQIITASGAVVGTTLTFSIKNVNINYDNVITFIPGTGITFGYSQNIFSGYQYNGIMTVTNVTFGSEALTLYTLNNTITNTTNWGIELGGFASVLDVIRVTDFLSVFNNPTEIHSASIISPTEVAGKVIYVNPGSAGIIYIDKSSSFMGVIADSNVILSPFIWTTGGLDFYIVNESSIPGADLSLEGIPDSVVWTLDPNSNMIIPAGYTGWFMIVLTVTDYPVLASMTSANIYCLGIFSNI